MFERVSLKRRFGLVLATLIAGFLALGLVAWILLAPLAVKGKVVQDVDLAQRLIADVLPPPEYIIEAYLVAQRIAREQDPENLGRLRAKFEQLKTEYFDHHEFWSHQNVNPRLSGPLLEDSYQPAKRFFELAETQFFPAIDAQDRSQSEGVLQALGAEYERHRLAIDELVKDAEAYVALVESEAIAALRRTFWVIGIGFAAITGLTFWFTNRVQQSVLRELGGEPLDVMLTTRRIASGDLLFDLVAGNRSEGSVMASLSLMRAELLDAVSSVVSNALHIESAGQEMLRVARGAEQTSEQQEVSSQAVLASVNRVTSAISVIRDETLQAQALATTTEAKAASVESFVNETCATLVATSSAVEGAAARVDQLAREVEEISHVVHIIREITEQTNLLALNAAIEAARAGDQGRGFAVVAGEVRALAERTAKSTIQIEGLVTRIQGGTKAVRSDMSNSSESLQASVRKVRSVGGEMTQIRDDANQVIAAVKAITTSLAVQEQSCTAVSRETHKMAERINETGGALQAVVRSAERSDKLAELLREAVNKFKLKDKPGASSRTEVELF